MDRVALRYKALSEPVRLRILNLLLAEGELCVCDIVEALELPQSTISRHLAILRQAGWIEARRQGVWMYYRMAESHEVPLPEGLRALLAGELAATEQGGKDLLRLRRLLAAKQTSKCT